MQHSTFAWALAASAAAFVPGADAATVYDQDFESNSLGWSGAGSVQSSEGLSAFGFGKMHLRNDSTGASVLTLSGLAAHSEMTLSFSLAMWDSLDLGDRFVIIADGVTLYDSTDFGNYFPPDGLGRGPGTQITPTFTSFSAPGLGYNANFRDSARSVSFTFAHSASSVSFSFQMPTTQGRMDESFGLDNVLVSTNATAPIPEPGSWALMLGGVAILGWRLRTARKG